MNDRAFDFGLSGFVDFWSQAGKMAQQAQTDAARSFTEAMAAWTGKPDATGPVPAGNDEALTRASETVAELWQSAAALSSRMATWLFGATAGATLDPAVEPMFRAIADPRTWLAGAGMDSVVGAIAQGPQLADLWNAERQQARVMQTWSEMRRRALEHNAVVMQGWLRAARTFGDEIARRSRADGRAPDHRAAMALWVETANGVLLETQRSDPFLQSQAATIRAGANFKMAQQEMADRLAVQFGLPSRTELDDLHRSVTELRREVRALRRQQTEAGS